MTEPDTRPDPDDVRRFLYAVVTMSHAARGGRPTSKTVSSWTPDQLRRLAAVPAVQHHPLRPDIDELLEVMARRGAGTVADLFAAKVTA